MLWCEAIRVVVLEAHIDVLAGLDLLPAPDQEQWRGWLVEAMAPSDGPVPGARFKPNGFTVTALQAAIAGGLLGGRWGASAVPSG